MLRLTSFFAGLVVAMLTAEGALAEGNGAAVPGSTTDVVAVCDPIIKLERTGDQSRRGECISAVSVYLTARVGPPALSDDPNTEVANLVLELANLYDPAVCRPNDTELSEAITKASAYSSDADQQALVSGIGQNISDCADIETAAIDEPLAAATASP